MAGLRLKPIFKMKIIIKVFLSGTFFLVSLFNSGYSSEIKERIKEIQISGNQYFDLNKLRSRMKLEPGNYYSDRLLEKSTEAILKLYDDHGFPYCQVDFGDFNSWTGSEGTSPWLSFKLKITEGPRVRIRKTEFEGNRYTKEEILKRAVNIDSLDYFSQKSLEAGLYRLHRLYFIKEVKSAELIPEPDPSWAVLRIEVEEKRQNCFLGVLGYVPSTQNRRGYFSGKLNFVFDNIFGTGKKAEIGWSKKDPYSSDLAFVYLEPYLFQLPLGLELSLRQIDYDSSYLRLELNSSLNYSPLNKIVLGISTGWEKTTADEKLKSSVLSSRKYKAGIKFCLDWLDYPVNPGKGLYYQTQIIYGRKNYLSSPGFEAAELSAYETRVLMDLNNFVPVFRDQVLALSLHLREIESPEKTISAADLFYLGGLNSLRGYREEEFSGDELFWSNLEYRLILSPESRAYLFWDFGHFSRRSENPLTKTRYTVSGSKSGFGLGLKVDTRLGVYEVDYALGERDRFSEGKIHFGISNRF
jgi:outer membrane protein insertion porin family